MRRRVPRSPAGWPSTHASPDVGASRPSRSLTDVVLPAPLGPRKPKISPRGTVIERPASAIVLPNRFVRSTVCMAGEEAAIPVEGMAAVETDAVSATHAGYTRSPSAIFRTSDCLTEPATTKTSPLIQITAEPRPVLSPSATPSTVLPLDTLTLTFDELPYSTGTGMSRVVDGSLMPRTVAASCGEIPGSERT